MGNIATILSLYEVMTTISYLIDNYSLNYLQPNLEKLHLWHIIILYKRLPSNTRYLAILYRKPMKFGIQEEH